MLVVFVMIIVMKMEMEMGMEILDGSYYYVWLGVLALLARRL